MHGLGLSNAQLLKVSEAKGILFISLSTLLMYVLVEKALRQRHSVAVAYWQLVETAQEGVWSVDAEGKTVFANENMAAILGTSPGEMIGKSILPFVPQEKQDELLNRLLRRERGLQEHYEFAFLRADGAQVWTLLRVSPVFRHGQHTGSLALVSDITERKRAEEALRRSNRELRAISDCNQVLLHATDEQSLLEEICRIVCEEAGYRMAWVSYAEHDEAKSVRPVAWTGAEEGYLASAGITWADTERGRGPTGTAIRSGKSCCVQDFAADPRLAPWREGLLQRGFRSGVALPLKDEQANAFGCLTIHSAQPNAFTPEEVRLLEELAGDMAFGIVTQRSRAARKQAEQALRQSEAYLAEAQRVSHTGSWYLDVVHNRLSWSDEAFRIFGIQFGTPLTYETFLAAVHTDDRAFIDQAWKKALLGEAYDIEHRILVGREVRWVREMAQLEFDADGRATKGIGTVQDITERRRAEEAQREQAALLNLTHDTVFVMDMEGVIKYWNRGAEERYGWNGEQAVGKVVHDMLNTVFPSPLEEIKAEVTRAGRWEGELLHTKKDGTQLVVASRWALQRDEQGAPLAILETNNDITERKRAEERLRKSEAYLAEAQRLSHTGSWALDVASGNYVYSSEEYIRISGFDPQQGLPAKDQPLQQIHPDDVDKFWQAYQKLVDEKMDSEAEYRIVLPDGTVKYVHAICHPVLNANGELVEVVGTTIDITERKRAEEALRRSEAYLVEAQRLSHTGSFAFDVASNKYVYISEECFRIFEFDAKGGFPNRDAVFRLIHPEDQDCVNEEFEKAIHEKVDTSSEFRIVLPSGTVKHVHAIRHPVLNDAGDLVELVGSVIDITERKRAEETLRRTTDYLADAQRLTHIGVWAGDRDSNPLYWSEEVFRIFGFDPQQGMPTREQALERINPEDFDNFQRRTINDKGHSEGEFRIILPDGIVRHVYGSAHPVFDRNGEVAEVMGVIVDVTERKRAEQERERLRQLEADLAHINRVSIMGELAASIAHEVNQPLSGVVSNAGACLRWLARDTPDVEEVREAVRDIVRDGKRAGEVVARIRALTKKAAGPRDRLDLNETIREVLALVGDEARRSSVIVRTQFADDLSPVAGDRVQLQQVVLNLVMNAIEAMSSVVERARELVIATRNVDPDQVQVTVEDSGIGVDPQKIDKIFDSFYTTKSGGMGMGLSISRSILLAHGGRLWATAKDGAGTIFHFTLPKYHKKESYAGVAGV